jgi:hypothetical protein
MFEITQADVNAANELALDMKWTDAMKFLREMNIVDGLCDAM